MSFASAASLPALLDSTASIFYRLASSSDVTMVCNYPVQAPMVCNARMGHKLGSVSP